MWAAMTRLGLDLSTRQHYGQVRHHKGVFPLKSSMRCTTPSGGVHQSRSHLCRLASETEAAREESVENARILAPLRKYLEPFMEPSDYQSLPETFQARFIAHLLCTIPKST